MLLYKCGVGETLFVWLFGFSYFVLILGYLVVVYGSLAKDSPFEPYKKNSLVGLSL